MHVMNEVSLYQQTESDGGMTGNQERPNRGLRSPDRFGDYRTSRDQRN